MKIKKEYPPNYEEIKKAFKLHEGIIFTYGDTIYNPDDRYIDKPLEKHEEVHYKQQGDNPKEWWQRYLVDVYFRLSQEVRAYQIQYRTAKSINKDREKLNKYAHLLALDLSGVMYGKIISYQDAIIAIKSKQTFIFKV